MASIDRTAYPRFKRVVSCRELAESSPSIVTPLNHYIGYDEAATEDAWSRTFAFFGEQLAAT